MVEALPGQWFVTWQMGVWSSFCSLVVKSPYLRYGTVRLIGWVFILSHYLAVR